MGKEITQSSPAELISQAVAGGADLEKLKGLLDIQMQWEANEARKAYNRAMAGFKANPPEIDKDRKIEFSTSKGRVSYSHATLHNIVRKVTSELSQHGLSASWRTQQNGKIVVTCRITHELGHYEETSLSADADASGSKNDIQQVGSTISYLERYSLMAILGLAAHDQDDDGASRSKDEPITPEQVEIIKSGLKELGDSEEPMLKFLGVEKLEDIKKSQYPKAQSAILQRKAMKGVKK